MGDTFRTTIITNYKGTFFFNMDTRFQFIIIADYKHIDSIYNDRVVFILQSLQCEKLVVLEKRPVVSLQDYNYTLANGYCILPSLIKVYGVKTVVFDHCT